MSHPWLENLEREQYLIICVKIVFQTSHDNPGVNIFLQHPYFSVPLKLYFQAAPLKIVNISKQITALKNSILSSTIQEGLLSGIFRHNHTYFFEFFWHFL